MITISLSKKCYAVSTFLIIIFPNKWINKNNLFNEMQ